LKHIALLLVLLSLGACTSGGAGSAAGGSGPLDWINSAPPDTAPGCYDHKNRLERTVTTAAECAALTWVWKPQGNPAAASAPR